MEIMYFLCFPVDGVLCQKIQGSNVANHQQLGGQLPLPLWFATLMFFFPVFYCERFCVCECITGALYDLNCERACVTQIIRVIDYLYSTH